MRHILPFLLLVGCATPPLRPAPDKLQPWTRALRGQQPDDASAAVYKRGSEHLLFVAAKHSNRDDSLTFRLIRDSYGAFAIDTVIAEGFATSRGANPPSLFKYAAENGLRADGFVEGGETVPTVLGARQEGAVLWGGEPDDRDILARVAAAGISPEDLLGFYVLRNIPQWIGEKKITDPGDPALAGLVESALARNRIALGLPPTTLPGFARWTDWYRSINGRPIGPGFVTEEVGPLADGSFGTNRIARVVSQARGAYLHELIIAQLNAKNTVMVVFGASHLMIHRPALDALLGPPCYFGIDLRRAASICGADGGT